MVDFECAYDEKKSKPGVGMGAIEHLTQRVRKLARIYYGQGKRKAIDLYVTATLENMFLGQGVPWQQVWKCLDSPGIQPLPFDSGSWTRQRRKQRKGTKY